MLSRTLNLPLQLLFLIHLGQIASSTLTIYAACFYIGFYVFFRHQTAPSAEYFIIFTVRLIPLHSLSYPSLPLSPPPTPIVA